LISEGVKGFRKASSDAGASARNEDSIAGQLHEGYLLLRGLDETSGREGANNRPAAASGCQFQ
jgi:hypothetical protein